MAFLLNNILMFGINISLGHIFTELYHKEITCTSSTVSTSGRAKGYLGIVCTFPGLGGHYLVLHGHTLDPP